MADAKHQQCVVIFPVKPDQLSILEIGGQLALYRPFKRNVFQPVHAKIERGVPRPAKFLCPRLTPQIIAIALRHIDHPCRAGDAAGVGQRLDKRPLPLWRPTIMPHLLTGNGREVWQSRSRFTFFGNPVLHQGNCPFIPPQPLRPTGQFMPQIMGCRTEKSFCFVLAIWECFWHFAKK